MINFIKNPMVLRLIVVVFLTALALLVWHMIAEKYREEGRNELQPKLTYAIEQTHKWKKVHNDLLTKVDECNTSVSSLHELSEEKTKVTQKLIQDAMKNNAKLLEIALDAERRISTGGTCEQAVIDARKDLVK
jgi:cytoskeletal protein RodZ